ncbi:hypothetical protein EXM22_05670 [Oceanispirochaeta crateris]|uniref:Glycosyltransferase family 2 protein n=2 Tax=Oceanispirochaeta crateris TaxID=2518645 RepID=A0A5C1QIS6_9SPIO|nr:hypothetical protein EXM22_05670 [Oceanispirochaeta crateris]
MMNTTAITSNSLPGYTVVTSGDSERETFEGITIVLLSRGGRPFRKEQIQKLAQMQVQEILSVENPGSDLDGLTRMMPTLKCIVMPDHLSTGEKINIAMRESSGSHVLVMWDDMDLQIIGKTGRLFAMASEQDSLCSVPVLMNARKDSIPIRLAPVFSGSKLDVIPLGSVKNETPTLYPFDYCGIYNRAKFNLSEGFDPKIRSPYWQKLDFGFRAFLWGEKVQCFTGIKIAYQNEIPHDDITIDFSYKRFFLKNLALIYKGDSCHLSIKSILRFHLQSRMSLFNSFKDYREIWQWVRVNTYRFQLDPYSLTELWELE